MYMKKRLVSALSLLLLVSLLIGLLSGCGNSKAVPADTTENAGLVSSESAMDDKQLASYSMLNYLSYVLQDINTSTQNRVVLDNYFTALLNNVEPSKIDDDALAEFNNVLNTIKTYRLNDIDREKTHYFLDQGNALAFLSVVPDPKDLVEAVAGKDPVMALASIALQTMGSISEQMVASEQEIRMLELQWDLEKSEVDAIMSSRQDLFNYRVKVSQNLPEGSTFNELDIDEFVKQTSTGGVESRLDWLKNNQGKYKYFGNYWLELADCYYAKQDYKNCLSSIAEYENIDTHIFRLDKRYAQTLPFAIASARETMSGKDKEKAVARYTEALNRNTDYKDWELRYVVASSYAALYSDTKNTDYLKLSYDTVKGNVQNLVAEQKNQNKMYLAEVREVPELSDKEKQEENKIIEAYNKYIKNKRKAELPPVYEPLLLNCELLFTVADELGISQDEKAVIDNILHDEPVFLSREMNQKYAYSESIKNQEYTALNLDYSGSKSDQKVVLPAVFTPDGTVITADIFSGGRHYYLNNWTVQKVDRNKSDNISDFEAVFTTSSDDKIKFQEGDTVTMTIKAPGCDNEEDAINVVLRVEKVNVLGVKFEQVT